MTATYSSSRNATSPGSTGWLVSRGGDVVPINIVSKCSNIGVSDNMIEIVTLEKIRELVEKKSTWHIANSTRHCQNAGRCQLADYVFLLLTEVEMLRARDQLTHPRNEQEKPCE